MDQSNEDRALREKMLIYAVNLEAAAGPQGISDSATQNARSFYLFVTGRDPILDGENVIEPADPEEKMAEVIDMRTGRILNEGSKTYTPHPDTQDGD